jgi:hypothetical protein
LTKQFTRRWLALRYVHEASMKNILQVFILLLFIGAISSTAKSDTSIRYALCQNIVKKIEVVPQGNQYSLHIALTESAAENFLRLNKR